MDCVRGIDYIINSYRNPATWLFGFLITNTESERQSDLAVTILPTEDSITSDGTTRCREPPEGMRCEIQITSQEGFLPKCLA